MLASRCFAESRIPRRVVFAIIAAGRRYGCMPDRSSDRHTLSHEEDKQLEGAGRCNSATKADAAARQLSVFHNRVMYVSELSYNFFPDQNRS